MGYYYTSLCLRLWGLEVGPSGRSKGYPRGQKVKLLVVEI